MPLSAPEYWLEWTKNYFRCQFTHVGELIHKETWSAASFGWAEGLQTINPPIYRLTTAVSDIDQTNINRDIRDGNWLSTQRPQSLCRDQDQDQNMSFSGRQFHPDTDPVPPSTKQYRPVLTQYHYLSIQMTCPLFNSWDEQCSLSTVVR